MAATLVVSVTYIVVSPYCTPEINLTLCVNNTSMKNKKQKTKKNTNNNNNNNNNKNPPGILESL